MYLHSVFLEFIKFACFYVILKALIQFINIEARRSGINVLSGIAGLFA